MKMRGFGLIPPLGDHTHVKAHELSDLSSHVALYLLPESSRGWAGSKSGKLHAIIGNNLKNQDPKGNKLQMGQIR